MRNFSVLLSARAAGGVLQAVLYFFFARDAGPSWFGTTSMVISIAILVGAVSEYGTATYLSKVVAIGDLRRMRSVTRFNGWSTLLLCVLWLITGLVGTFYLPYALSLALIGIAMTLDKYAEIGLSPPVARGHMGPVTVSLTIRRGSALGLYLAGLSADPVSNFAISLLVSQLAGGVYARVLGRRDRARSVKPAPLRGVLKSATPFFVATIASQVRFVDVALVGALAGPSAAGLYSAADKVVRPVMLVPQTLTTLVLPRSSRHTPSQARSDAQRLVVAASCTLIVLLPAAVFAGPLIGLTLGPDYSEAAPALAFMLISLPLVALAAPLGALLQGQGRERLVGQVSVIFAVSVIFFASAGAITAGAVGAAAGVAFAAASRVIPLLVAAFRLRDEPRKEGLI